MRHFGATPSSDGVESGREDDASGCSRTPQPGPHLGKPPESWLILKRGPARMALFRGCPSIEVIELLDRLHLAVGLVLVGAEPLPPPVQAVCSYILMAPSSRAASAFADATRDLARSGWRVDRSAALPVMIRSGALASAADPGLTQRLEA